MTTHPTPTPRTHTKHDDWWCECGLRIEDCDDCKSSWRPLRHPERIGLTRTHSWRRPME